MSAVTRAEFYSDRTGGPAPRDKDVLPEHTARGLLNLVQSKIDSDWFAQRFPDQCPDGNGVAGTNIQSLRLDLQALIPDLDYPLLATSNVPDEAVFDLIEYAAQRIALAQPGSWHSYFSHHELTFDVKAGRRVFHDEINQILARGRTTYELAPSLQVQRTGSPEVREQLSDLRPATGDGVLDELIVEARTLYLSHRVGDRKLGLEKLWDAFERLKTIEIPGGDKKASAAKLLAHIADEPFHDLAEAEMIELTKIGNTFNLRHHETGKHAVPEGGYDYLFARLSNLVILLLRHSDWLA